MFASSENTGLNYFKKFEMCLSTVVGASDCTQQQCITLLQGKDKFCWHLTTTLAQKPRTDSLQLGMFLDETNQVPQRFLFAGLHHYPKTLLKAHHLVAQQGPNESPSCVWGRCQSWHCTFHPRNVRQKKKHPRNTTDMRFIWQNWQGKEQL